MASGKLENEISLGNHRLAKNGFDEIYYERRRKLYMKCPNYIVPSFTSNQRQLSRAELLKRCPPYNPTGHKTPRQWIDEFYHEVLIFYSDVFERANWFAEFMGQGDFTHHLEEDMRVYIEECREYNIEPSLVYLAAEFYAQMWTDGAQRVRLEEFEKSSFDPLEKIISMQRYIKNWLDILDDITLSDRRDPIGSVMLKLPKVFYNFVVTRFHMPRTRYELVKIVQRFFEQKGYDWNVILSEYATYN